MRDTKKIILDACCGGKMFWFEKNNDRTIYHDIRRTEKGFIKVRPNFEVKPDVIGDFRKLQFKDRQFKMVVFDPPHLKGAGESGWMAKKYGTLNKDTWREDLKQGFKECWRVLKKDGFLIFK